MLSDAAPNLKIQTDKQNILYAYVDADYQIVREFANWLYTAEIDNQIPFQSLPEFRGKGIGLGRAVGCVNYMDTMLDQFMELLYDLNPFSLNEVINPLVEEFPRDTEGWRLAIDYTIYCKVGCADNCWIYDELRRISNEDFVIDVATGIREEISSCDWVGDKSDPEYCKVIVSGYCEQKRSKNDQRDENLPWVQDKCQYHRHTELGLPCYVAKAGEN